MIKHANLNSNQNENKNPLYRIASGKFYSFIFIAALAAAFLSNGEAARTHSIITPIFATTSTQRRTA
jgi:uncharacterized protein (UPF0332 family)